ncbi:MAG: hypothetical protein LBU70_00975 [Chitinispirillales bacterium]|jgi:hypothetical protein|nr:hypothetical protein [Chitinispirillales bacterium]
MKPRKFVVAMVFLLSTALMISCSANRRRQQVEQPTTVFSDVIAVQGQSEIVLNNETPAQLHIMVGGQSVGLVAPRSVERVAISDGNHQIKVQSGNSASREQIHNMRSQRYVFTATGTATSLQLTRSSVNAITPGAAPAAGAGMAQTGTGTAGTMGGAAAAPTQAGLAADPLYQDRERHFERMDAHFGSGDVGSTPSATTPAPASTPAPTPVATPTTPATTPAPTQAATPAAATAAPAAKPQIAVYVTDGSCRCMDVGPRKALGTQILQALVRSGKYIAVERTEEFVNMIEREHMTQRSESVDEDQIRALGRQFGVQLIAIADITQALGSFNVSVRIIDIETAQVVSVASIASPLRNMNDLTEASTRIARALLRD